MATQDRTEFRFDCGATWLNLLATRGNTFGAHPVERLDSPARLADWLTRADLRPHHPPASADLAAAVQLRETLRALALATVDGRPPPPAAVADLSALLADHADPIRLTATDRLRRHPPATATTALARIARQAAEHLTGADRVALKVCPEHDCRGVFTDPTDRRRWCPSPTCATRGRVRALRARRATTPAATTDPR